MCPDNLRMLRFEGARVDDGVLRASTAPVGIARAVLRPTSQRDVEFQNRRTPPRARNFLPARERCFTHAAHACGLCGRVTVRAFARTRRLQFRGSYARIEGAKSFIFRDITYIIRTSHLRSRNSSRHFDEGFQRDSRLFGDPQRICEIRFDLPISNARNVGLALRQALRELSLRLARLFEVSRQVWIRAPRTAFHDPPSVCDFRNRVKSLEPNFILFRQPVIGPSLSLRL